jgi:NAD(P)-dependent dehydrogenase (short-subunit alcohol dehydrogenase family)
MKAPSVVVITGAGSGVGRATARAFASMGAAVGLVARGEDALETTVKEVSSAGGRPLAIPTDVADAEAVERAADAVEDQLGPVEVWVNNAMTTVFAPFAEISPEEYRRVTEVTYLGQVHGTRAALARMLPRDRGTVVCVGSSSAYRGLPLQTAYSGAEHAIEGFTESVRCELLHSGSRVRITMVQLPGTNTPQFEVVLSRLPYRPQPIPPIYQPEVAARAIVWASTHRRRELWVGGSTAATILANQLAPGLLDRYLARTAYRSQQTGQRAHPDQPTNLWGAVAGDRGAHGPFDPRAHQRSAQFWASRHHGLVVGAAAIAGAGVAAVRLARGRGTGRGNDGTRPG